MLVTEVGTQILCYHHSGPFQFGFQTKGSSHMGVTWNVKPQFFYKKLTLIEEIIEIEMQTRQYCYDEMHTIQTRDMQYT